MKIAILAMPYQIINCQQDWMKSLSLGFNGVYQNRFSVTGVKAGLPTVCQPGLAFVVRGGVESKS